MAIRSPYLSCCERCERYVNVCCWLLWPLKVCWPLKRQRGQPSLGLYQPLQHEWYRQQSAMHSCPADGDRTIPNTRLWSFHTPHTTLMHHARVGSVSIHTLHSPTCPLSTPRIVSPPLPLNDYSHAPFRYWFRYCFITLYNHPHRSKVYCHPMGNVDMAQWSPHHTSTSASANYTNVTSSSRKYSRDK